MTSSTLQSTTRFSASAPYAVVARLAQLGRGSISRGIRRALAIAESSPDFPHDDCPPLNPSRVKRGRLRRDDLADRNAYIYYECVAGKPRAAIAKAYGLSVIRIQQIYAALRSDPPPMPAAVYAPQVVTHAMPDEGLDFLDFDTPPKPPQPDDEVAKVRQALAGWRAT